MNPRVLIVDDEFGLAETIADLLAARGVDVVIAMNGKRGLDMLEQALPQLVLLDTMMPVMDGQTMLARMREDSRFAAIPVVMLTSLPESVLARSNPPCQEIVRKPFSPERLFEIVERYLR